MGEKDRGLGMKRSVLVIGISLLVSLFYFGCGGGGEEGSSVGNLQGTWLGVIDDLSGTLQEFSLQVDSDGNVVEVKINDVVTGETGYINDDWDENLFHVLYDFNPGSTSPLQGGIMIVDNSYRHATYGDWGVFMGILEKGAPSLSSYASSDIVGSYTGGAFEFDFPSGNWEGEAISMTVNTNLTFSGNSSSGAFSGGFNAPAFIPNYGHYAGTMDVPLLGTLDITALVSPDKTYVAAYAKDIGTTPSLDGYILIGLIK